MKFIFLGDVHGNLIRCLNVAESNPDSTIVQIGDFGIGFLPIDVFLRLPKNFKFFVGNHDKRQEAKTLPHCLGDYGEAYEKFFFVSGADSIDKDMRIEGVSWWPDEELTYKQAEDCLDKWENSKVEVLVSHDCPQSIAEKYLLVYDKSLTRNLLQKMIDIRKPKLLVYGHHHQSKRVNFNDIDVKELGIDETFSVDIV